MRIDGKQIAKQILLKLSREVNLLKTKGATPRLAVILVGDNPASLSYIKQKQKAAEKIGAAVKLFQFPFDSSLGVINETMKQCNNDNSIHGLIIQRPLPVNFSGDRSFLTQIKREKDVDGFLPNSPFTVPVVSAVLTILKSIFNDLTKHHELSNMNFLAWLKTQFVAIIGRGETAGQTIAQALTKRGCRVAVIHSQTQNSQEILKKSKIIISCVGKKRVVTLGALTPETILIGVGIWKDETGRLHGDYEEEEIGERVAYFTPTPGGVGPVNVASLMQNLVKAAKLTEGGTSCKIR